MNLNNKIRQCRREDFDTIFLVANSRQERQIIPLLRFYYADDVSIYATSAIYSPSVIIDYDLDGMIFDDMPWVLAPEL
ncbi:penicillin-binding protein activator [Candidatus Coxiella mudrowiae]|uniref:penicillin-binding protein activator n=1 Tax=Candidatus Coxiella mudrowiae TaxID=2054173 RepID=UPI002467E768|nr:penicillin-binding protein activator [Candidatus Coxiella mudrowiae]